jgi:transposase
MIFVILNQMIRMELAKENQEDLSIDNLQKNVLIKAIKIHGKNQKNLAKIIGVSKSTVFRWKKKYKV